MCGSTPLSSIQVGHQSLARIERCQGLEGCLQRPAVGACAGPACSVSSDATHLFSVRGLQDVAQLLLLAATTNPAVRPVADRFFGPQASWRGLSLDAARQPQVGGSGGNLANFPVNSGVPCTRQHGYGPQQIQKHLGTSGRLVPVTRKDCRSHFL